MKSSKDRFKKRKSSTSRNRSFLDEKNMVHRDSTDLSVNILIESSSLSLPNAANPDQMLEPDVLLAELHGKIDQDKISALIDSCQRECLTALTRPFGIGKVLFEGQMGGNTATIKNVRNEDYVASEKTAYVKSGEKQKYEAKDEYNSHEYHGHSKYREKNRKDGNLHAEGKLIDSYSNEVISGNRNLDHVVSAKEIHEDRARVLAELNGPELANKSENLKSTSETINKGKKQKSVSEFVDWTDHTKNPVLDNEISKISAIKNPTEDQKEKLKKLISDKKKYEKLDRDKIKKADKEARDAIEHQINTSYHTSTKFLKSTLAGSIIDGRKMALQQALGILMEEFVRATFDEIKDIWKSGFKDKVDDRFIDVLKERLIRVAKRTISKWKDAAYSLPNGFISGFLSSLVTVMINVFVTTSARLGMIIREGFLSLYQAFKMLAFPDEGTSMAAAADAALKILATALVTTGGILIESHLAPYLLPLGPLANYVLVISVGLITGVTAASTIYLLERMDFFGVHADTKHSEIISRLNESIDSSYKTALDTASVFDGPTLHHLT